ncbi:glycoprotein-N-acetylgalactosamine 3-beta-galactosyltransferase 1-like [Culicoides brevitarsis]|uniref:glycoprotein-N-acetylgalactosamine 3-beta-galactosyltransferase 1-like n=1 Tax=Culicoides brevitarsis TaxID=469753 RepID=UPI00307BB918
MRLKRTVIIDVLYVIAGYVIGRVFMWGLLKFLPYHWDGTVELDYVHPLVMDGLDDYSRAYDIKKRVRILCWAIVDDADDMRENFRHAAVTWAQKCTETIYLSVDDLDSHPEIGGNEDKILKGLHLLSARKDLRQFDWILKFYANVYVVMENLRHSLLPFTATSAIPFVHATYAAKMSTTQKPILIFNVAAVDRLLGNYAPCQTTNYPFDMENCLAFNNVTSITFNNVSNYADNGRFKEVKHCCQHETLYFYNVKPYDLYVFEYFLYGARVVGNSPDFR